MSRATTSLTAIESFFAQKRIAMVGISRDPKDFSGMLFRDLVRRGYDMVPVNPHAVAIEGHPCFPRVSEIRPKPDAALLMVPAHASEAIVRECADAGIGHIWLFRATNQGAVSESAVAVCRAQRINVVAGECPYMFLPHNGLHAIHGFLRRISGTYPQRKTA